MLSISDLRAALKDMRENNSSGAHVQTIDAIETVLDRRFVDSISGRTSPGSKPRLLSECGTASFSKTMAPYATGHITPDPQRRKPGELLFERRLRSPKDFNKWLRWKEKHEE